jgi:hypothetical protein
MGNLNTMFCPEPSTRCIGKDSIVLVLPGLLELVLSTAEGNRLRTGDNLPQG